jgi:hypothetical protein
MDRHGPRPRTWLGRVNRAHASRRGGRSGGRPVRRLRLTATLGTPARHDALEACSARAALSPPRPDRGRLAVGSPSPDDPCVDRVAHANTELPSRTSGGPAPQADPLAVGAGTTAGGSWPGPYIWRCYLSTGYKVSLTAGVDTTANPAGGSMPGGSDSRPSDAPGGTRSALPPAGQVARRPRAVRWGGWCCAERGAHAPRLRTG